MAQIPFLQQTLGRQQYKGDGWVEMGLKKVFGPNALSESALAKNFLKLIGSAPEKPKLKYDQKAAPYQLHPLQRAFLGGHHGMDPTEMNEHGGAALLPDADSDADDHAGSMEDRQPLKNPGAGAGRESSATSGSARSFLTSMGSGLRKVLTESPVAPNLDVRRSKNNGRGGEQNLGLPQHLLRRKILDEQVRKDHRHEFERQRTRENFVFDLDADFTNPKSKAKVFNNMMMSANRSGSSAAFKNFSATRESSVDRQQFLARLYELEDEHEYDPNYLRKWAKLVKDTAFHMRLADNHAASSGSLESSAHERRIRVHSKIETLLPEEHVKTPDLTDCFHFKHFHEFDKRWGAFQKLMTGPAGK
eukprot:g1216.t1